MKLTPKTPSPTFLPTNIFPINGIEEIVLLIVVAGTNVPLKLINDEKLIIKKELFKENYLKLSIGKKRHIKIELD